MDDYQQLPIEVDDQHAEVIVEDAERIRFVSVENA